MNDLFSTHKSSTAFKQTITHDELWLANQWMSLMKQQKYNTAH